MRSDHADKCLGLYTIRMVCAITLLKMRIRKPFQEVTARSRSLSKFIKRMFIALQSQRLCVAPKIYLSTWKWLDYSVVLGRWILAPDARNPGSSGAQSRQTLGFSLTGSEASGPGIQAITGQSPNAVSMLAQRLWRWANIEIALVEYPVFAGISVHTDRSRIESVWVDWGHGDLVSATGSSVY